VEGDPDAVEREREHAHLRPEEQHRGEGKRLGHREPRRLDRRKFERQHSARHRQDGEENPLARQRRLHEDRHAAGNDDDAADTDRRDEQPRGQWQ
jgi:hypothetical protein